MNSKIIGLLFVLLLSPNFSYSDSLPEFGSIKFYPSEWANYSGSLVAESIDGGLRIIIEKTGKEPYTSTVKCEFSLKKDSFRVEFDHHLSGIYNDSHWNLVILDFSLKPCLSSLIWDVGIAYDFLDLESISISLSGSTLAPEISSVPDTFVLRGNYKATACSVSPPKPGSGLDPWDPTCNSWTGSTYLFYGLTK